MLRAFFRRLRPGVGIDPTAGDGDAGDDAERVDRLAADDTEAGARREANRESSGDTTAPESLGDAADARARDAADARAGDAADARAGDADESAEAIQERSFWRLVPSWQRTGRYLETGGQTVSEQDRALAEIQQQADAVEDDLDVPVEYPDEH